MIINEFSEIGTRHSALNEGNQDAVCYGVNGRYAAISLADGVSSCKRAKAGAEIASRAMTNLLLKKGERFFAFEEQQIAELALSHIFFELRKQAGEAHEDVNAYSSTIASVLFDRKMHRMLCLNLGDGIILAEAGGMCRVLAMSSDSSDGCCVTTTKNGAAMATVKIVEKCYDGSVAICSDGAWSKMYAKNKLKPEVSALLANHDFDKLKGFLSSQGCADDYSFISIEFSGKMRKSAFLRKIFNRQS